MGKTIQVLAITPNGEMGIKQYIEDTEKTDYSRHNISKYKMLLARKISKANELLSEEYFDNPLRLHYSLKPKYAHFIIDYDKVRRSVSRILEKYNVGKDDIEFSLLTDPEIITGIEEATSEVEVEPPKLLCEECNTPLDHVPPADANEANCSACYKDKLPDLKKEGESND